MPFWKLYYHLVWATARRKPIITRNLEQPIYDAIRKKVESLNGEMYEICATDDHIHLAVSFPPSISIAKFVGELKGASAFYINHLSTNPVKLEWGSSYGAASFQHHLLDEVRGYVRQQKQLHIFQQIWPTLEDIGDGETVESEGDNETDLVFRQDIPALDPFA